MYATKPVVLSKYDCSSVLLLHDGLAVSTMREHRQSGGAVSVKWRRAEFGSSRRHLRDTIQRFQLTNQFFASGDLIQKQWTLLWVA